MNAFNPDSNPDYKRVHWVGTCKRAKEVTMEHMVILIPKHASDMGTSVHTCACDVGCPIRNMHSCDMGRSIRDTHVTWGIQSETLT